MCQKCRYQGEIIEWKKKIEIGFFKKIRNMKMSYVLSDKIWKNKKINKIKKNSEKRG